MPKNPPARWVDYTPAMAEKLLEQNTNNRKLRNQVVERYRRDMINKDWLPTGDTVKVAADGTLIDGQHRLAAVVAAGNNLPGPITILTVTELDHSLIFAVTDTGLVRRPADAVHMAGKKNSAALAASARLIIRFERGRIFKRSSVSTAQNQPTTTELLHWLDENPGFEDYVSQNLWMMHSIGIPWSPGVASAWFTHRVDPFRAAEFFDSLQSLSNLPEGSPILALNRTIRRIRMDKSRLEQAQWVLLVFRAFNAWQGDETISRRFSIHAAFPSRDNFPWPLTRAEALAGAETAAFAREMDASEDQPRLP